MRFVPIKSAEQQAVLALHTARSHWRSILYLIIPFSHPAMMT